MQHLPLVDMHRQLQLPLEPDHNVMLPPFVVKPRPRRINRPAHHLHRPTQQREIRDRRVPSTGSPPYKLSSPITNQEAELIVEDHRNVEVRYRFGAKIVLGSREVPTDAYIMDAISTGVAALHAISGDGLVVDNGNGEGWACSGFRPGDLDGGLLLGGETGPVDVGDGALGRGYDHVIIRAGTAASHCRIKDHQIKVEEEEEELVFVWFSPGILGVSADN